MPPSLKAGALIALMSLALVSGSAAALPPWTPQSLPSDPGFGAFPQPLKQIDAPAAWAAGTCSPAMRIAVVSTGVSPLSDLRVDSASGANYAEDKGPTETNDADGLGTSLASIVASGFNDGIGISGICPGATVVPVRVYTESGSSDMLVVAKGIQWAARGGAAKVILVDASQVSNTSPYVPIQRVIDDVVNRLKVVVVLKAGDKGLSSKDGNPLAGYTPDVIRVAGVELNGQLSPGSNFGDLADIGAPNRLEAATNTGTFGRGQGSSYAAAVVAGTAGMMLSLDPTLTPQDVKRKMMDSVTHVPGLPVASGGVVNVYNSLIATGYIPKQHLSVSVDGTGSGIVKDDSGIIECGKASRCNGLFASGSTVNLTAAPDADTVFTGWNGACSGVDLSCSVKLSSEDTAVTANFARKRVSLSVTRSGSGKGTVTSIPSGISCPAKCKLIREVGSIRLKAKPNPGSTFLRWTGTCLGFGSKPSCRFTLDRSLKVGAVFAIRAPALKVKAKKH